jgi:hypothetical protein
MMQKPSIPNQDKKRNKVLWIAGSVLVLLIGGGIIVYRKLRKKEANEQATTDEVSPAKETSVAERKPIPSFRCISRTYPLQPGTCHADVAWLQSYLKKQFQVNLGTTGRNRDGIDGQFGIVTREAVLKHLGKDRFTLEEINNLKSKTK